MPAPAIDSDRLPSPADAEAVERGLQRWLEAAAREPDADLARFMRAAAEDAAVRRLFLVHDDRERIERAYKSFQKGFTQKTQEIAPVRKLVEETLAGAGVDTDEHTLIL